MIQMKIVKWIAAGAMAFVAVPAIGMARHTHTVSAAASSLLTPASATPEKLVSHNQTASAKAIHKSKKHSKKRHAKKATTKKHKKHAKKKTHVVK